MPLFFIVYGMVVGKKEFISFYDWKSYLVKELQTLIVPYVIWALIYSNGFRINFILGVGYGSNPSLSYANTNAVLWFLPVMFLCTLFYQIALKMTSKSKKLLSMFLLSALVISAKLGSYIDWMRFPWGFDIALLGTAFMMIGHLLSKSIIKYVDSVKVYNKILLLILFLVISVITGVINSPENGKYPVCVMAVAEYGKSIMLFIISGLAGTFVIIMISKLIKIEIISYLGKHSLFMMAVHYIIFPYTLFIAKFLFHSRAEMTICIALVNSILVTLICIPLCYLVDKFCPVLNGK